MSIALLDRRISRGVARPGGSLGVGEPGSGKCAEEVARLIDEGRGARTLDELVTSTWGGLLASEAVRCPVCQGRMAALVGASRDVRGGTCVDCGAQLS
jgi:hypothetical protein